MKILEYEGKLVSENKRLIKTKQGGFAVSKEYKEAKKNYISSILIKEKLEKPYKLKIVVKTKKDIDNIIKPILDCLEFSEIIENDRYVNYLLIEKKKLKNKELEKVQVFTLD